MKKDDRPFDDDFKHALYVRLRAQFMFALADAYIDEWKAGRVTSFEEVGARIGQSASDFRYALEHGHGRREKGGMTELAGLFEALGAALQLQLIPRRQLSTRTFTDGDGI